MTNSYENLQRAKEYEDAVIKAVRANPWCNAEYVRSRNIVPRNYVPTILLRLTEKGVLQRSTKSERERVYYYALAPGYRPDGSDAGSVPVNPDAVMREIDTLKGMCNGTEFDSHIQTAISELSCLISDVISDCPFCGKRPYLRTGPPYGIQCFCGAIFDCAGANTLEDLISAYNRRASV